MQIRGKDRARDRGQPRPRAAPCPASCATAGAKVYAGGPQPGLGRPGRGHADRARRDRPGSVAAAAPPPVTSPCWSTTPGSSTGASLLTGDLDEVRLELDTHFFGTLAVIRAFAPQLAARGGGAVLNILSVLSWVSFPAVGAYSAAKSAEWSLTNALRQELAAQGTRVRRCTSATWTPTWPAHHRPQVRPGRHRQDRARRHRGGRRRDHRGRGQQAGAGRPVRRRRRALPPVRLTRPRCLTRVGLRVTGEPRASADWV